MMKDFQELFKREYFCACAFADIKSVSVFILNLLKIGEVGVTVYNIKKNHFKNVQSVQFI